MDEKGETKLANKEQYQKLIGKLTTSLVLTQIIIIIPKCFSQNQVHHPNVHTRPPLNSYLCYQRLHVIKKTNYLPILLLTYPWTSHSLRLISIYKTLPVILIKKLTIVSSFYFHHLIEFLFLHFIFCSILFSIFNQQIDLVNVCA